MLEFEKIEISDYWPFRFWRQNCVDREALLLVVCFTHPVYVLDTALAFEGIGLFELRILFKIE